MVHEEIEPRRSTLGPNSEVRRDERQFCAVRRRSELIVRNFRRRKFCEEVVLWRGVLYMTRRVSIRPT
jgi:hypothetical protein